VSPVKTLRDAVRNGPIDNITVHRYAATLDYPRENTYIQSRDDPTLDSYDLRGDIVVNDIITVERCCRLPTIILSYYYYYYYQLSRDNTTILCH
jgi:hypothetical protein